MTKPQDHDDLVIESLVLGTKGKQTTITVLLPQPLSLLCRPEHFYVRALFSQIQYQDIDCARHTPS